MNKDLFEPMKPTDNLELFQQEAGQKLGTPVVEPTTNLQLTETVLSTAPLAYNQDVKRGKTTKIDKLQSAKWQ
jgi:hypothetical protein